MQKLTKKRNIMKGKISEFLREHILILSLLTIIIGIIILIIGILGIWFKDEIKNMINFMDTLIPWSLYILIIELSFHSFNRILNIKLSHKFQNYFLLYLS